MAFGNNLGCGNTIPNVIVAPAGSNIETVADIIGLAKKQPGALAYASPGHSAATHMTAVSLEFAAHSVQRRSGGDPGGAVQYDTAYFHRP